MRGFWRRGFLLLLVIIFSFWAVSPLFHPGFFPMHDDTQVARVFEMAKAIASGQFPVRWVGDLGYGFGYPLFNFYAPLPYYIGAIFNLIGFDALVATKIMFLVGIILAGVTMFLLLDTLVGEVAALVGSLLYMYAPYHAVDVYVRGAVGEFYAMAFLPLVLLGIVEIIRVSRNDPGSNSRRNDPGSIGIIIGSLGIAGVFLSHNILGMITGYFLILFLLILFIISVIPSARFNRGVFKALLFAFLLGLGLSAFFTLPAIFEKNFTRVNELATGTNSFVNHFVYLDQLWNSPWGYAGSAPGRLDGMSFMIGKIHLILGLLAILSLLIFYKKIKLSSSHLSNVFCLLSLFTISVFLMLDISKPIWESVPGFSYVQYPWRLLVYSTLSLSIMISIPLSYFARNKQIILGVIVMSVMIWFNSKYFVPREYLSLKAEDYTSGVNLRFKTSKISDEYLPKDFINPYSLQGIALQGLTDNKDMKIMEFAENFTRKIYKVDVYNQIYLETNITYFPGWQVSIDKNYTPIQSKNGRIELVIPAGQHIVEFTFGNTPIRILANAISIFTIFLVVYIIVF